MRPYLIALGVFLGAVAFTLALEIHDNARADHVVELTPELAYITAAGVTLWKDPATGCEYFYPEGRPRLMPDGKPMCRATEDTRP